MKTKSSNSSRRFLLTTHVYLFLLTNEKQIALLSPYVNNNRLYRRTDWSHGRRDSYGSREMGRSIKMHGIASRDTIHCVGGLCTIVPKGIALLFVPIRRRQCRTDGLVNARRKVVLDKTSQSTLRLTTQTNPSLTELRMELIYRKASFCCSTRNSLLSRAALLVWTQKQRTNHCYICVYMYG